MAACCGGSIVEAVMSDWGKPQPKHECWSLPEFLGPDRSTLRAATHAKMRQTDALDYSTVYCRCGSCCTWPPDKGLDGFLDMHARCA